METAPSSITPGFQAGAPHVIRAAFFDICPAAMAVTCPSSGRIVDVNEGFCDLFGYNRDELIGVSTRELGIWVDEQDRQGFVAELIRTGILRSRRVSMRGKGGRVFQVEFTSRVMSSESGPLLYSLVIDVSSEVAAKASLAKSEEHFRLLVENIHDLVVELDEAGRFCYVSPNHESVLGYRPEALLGASALELVHPEDQASWLRILEEEGRDRVNLRVRKADGNWCFLQIAANHLPAGNNQGRLIIASRDVTAQVIAEREQERVEMQLRQAQKMEAIGTLAGGIAHDFNNILSVIIGYADVLREDFRGQAQASEDLEKILQGAQRAKSLVRQILSFCRQGNNEKSQVKLSDLVYEVAGFLRTTVPQGVCVEANWEDGLPPVFADSSQLHQVLMNLCTNAIHAFKGKPGRLELQVCSFLVDEEFVRLHSGLSLGSHIRLSVCDNGCGMSQETLRHIFEPFFTTKGPGEGTGLGLAVVHGIVKAHQGAIYVYSREGEGTTFHIYLPVPTQAEGGAASVEVPLKFGRGERILFVDDEIMLCAAAERILGKLGYAVTLRNDPAAALELFRADSKAFDLVFTDYAMRDSNGLSFARAIHALRPEIPIVMATGFAGNLAAGDLMEAGVRELVFKPLNTQLFSSIIARNLSGDPR